jgi:four helix bundle protein
MKNTSIKTYKDLIVWQKAHSLAKRIIMLCRRFPDSDEARIIKKQLIRSSTSVPANIAEGHGGHQGKEYQHYLTIARRSANETDYWVLLAHDLKYINAEVYSQLEENCREIVMMLSSIIGKLRGKK